MKQFSTLKKLWSYLQLIVGCVICAIGVNWIAIPNGFAVSGMTGLAMTFEKLTGIHYAWASYGIMAIVLILTLVVMGVHEVANILFLSVMYPAVLLGISYVPVEIIFQEKLIAVAAFGICYGVGTGMSYRLGYSYGGTDTLGKVLKNTILKSVPLKNILMGEDVVILQIMLAVFKLDVVAYAFVGQFIYANSLNFVVFSTGPKLFEIQIICNKVDAVEKFVIDDIHKSVTVHHIVGGYSGEEKIQLDCVCTSKEYVRLKDYLKNLDIEYFIKVLPLTQAYGKNKDFMTLEDNVVD